MAALSGGKEFLEKALLAARMLEGTEGVKGIQRKNR